MATIQHALPGLSSHSHAFQPTATLHAAALMPTFHPSEAGGAERPLPLVKDEHAQTTVKEEILPSSIALNRSLQASDLSRQSSLVTEGDSLLCDEEEEDMDIERKPHLWTRRGARGSVGHGRWTEKEHQRFLEGMKMFGRAWKTIAKQVVKTRTAEQVRIHAQKYFSKQANKTGKPRAVHHDGHWTNEEHEMFLVLYEKYGKAWKKISEVLKTRTNEQIRTHAQKYFSKLGELRHRGFDGQYNMDGRRHLTKTFLHQSSATYNKNRKQQQSTASQWSKGSSQQSRSSNGSFFQERQYSAASSTSSLSSASAASYDHMINNRQHSGGTYVSRSGRQVTARRWGEDEQLYGLSGDEDEEEEEDDDEYYQEQEGEVYYWRNRRDAMDVDSSGPSSPEDDDEDDEDYHHQSQRRRERQPQDDEDEDDGMQAAATLLRWQQYSQHRSSPRSDSQSAWSDSSTVTTPIAATSVATPHSPRDLSILIQAANTGTTAECPSTISSNGGSPPPSPTELQGAAALLSWQS